MLTILDFFLLDFSTKFFHSSITKSFNDKDGVLLRMGSVPRMLYISWQCQKVVALFYLEGKVVTPPVFSSEKPVGSGIDTPFLFTKRLGKKLSLGAKRILLDQGGFFLALLAFMTSEI